MLKGGSLEIQLITASENLSSYIISLYVLEETQQYANSFIISIFLFKIACELWFYW